MARYYNLPRTFEFGGRTYSLDWETNNNMDGFVARFELARKPRDEDECDMLEYEMWECGFKARVSLNGSVALHIKA